MKLNINYNNVKAKIQESLGDPRSETNAEHKSLRVALAYVMPDRDFSPAYKSGAWDGLISLYNGWKQEFPTGLISRAAKTLEVLGYDVERNDVRQIPAKNLVLDTTFAKLGRELRFYQVKACDEAVMRTRGILEIATGGGKTMLACELLKRLGVAPVLFVVPSLSLLTQTHDEFEKYLTENDLPARVGMIGDGICDINMRGINVATYHTLLAAFNEVLVTTSGRDPKTGRKLLPNRIETTEFAGECVKKTLSELEIEFEAADFNYQKAFQAAKRQTSALQVEIQQAERDWIAAGGLTKLKRDQTAFQKSQSKKQRELNTIQRKGVDKQKMVLDKARAALESRRTSLRRKKSIRDLIEAALALVVDEAHIAAIVTETIGAHAENAYYRYGMSATPYREDNQEIRVEGTMGRKLIQISVSDLTELGYLCPGHFIQIGIDHIEHDENDTYSDIYRKHITNCWERNYKIKRVAEEFKAENMPTLIIVDHIDHGRILEAMIKDSVFVEGSDNGADDPSDDERSYRVRMLDKCQANEIILIATSWANTGIDAPKLQGLVLAGCISSTNTLYQTVGRVARVVGKDINESIANGKPYFVCVDFNESQEKLHAASAKRWKVFGLERAWKRRRMR